jgi:Gas vesicle protein
MTATIGADVDVLARSSGRPTVAQGPAIALVDLLDRLLGTGIVIAGDVVISLAGVDLVEVRLRALVTTIRAEMARAQEEGGRR